MSTKTKKKERKKAPKPNLTDPVELKKVIWRGIRGEPRREWTVLDQHAANEGRAANFMKRQGRSAYQPPKKKKTRGGAKDRARRSMLTGFGHEVDRVKEESKIAKAEEKARKEAEKTEAKKAEETLIDQLGVLQAKIAAKKAAKAKANKG